MGIIDPYINERFKYLLFKLDYFKNGVALSEILSPSKLLNRDFVSKLSSTPARFSIVLAKGERYGEVRHNVELEITSLLKREYSLLGYDGPIDGAEVCAYFPDMVGYGKLWFIKKKND